MQNIQINNNQNNYPIYTFIDENPLNQLVKSAICDDMQYKILEILKNNHDVQTIHALLKTCKSWSAKIKSYPFLELSAIGRLYGSIPVIYSQGILTFTQSLSEVISYFCKLNQPHLVKFLLKNSNQTIVFGTLLKACEEGQSDIVRIWINDESVINSENCHLLISRTIENGHVDVVRLLIEIESKDCFFSDDYFFMSAVKKGKIDIVRFFLEERQLDPSLNNNEAYIKAKYFGYKEIAELLLKDERVQNLLNN